MLLFFSEISLSDMSSGDLEVTVDFLTEVDKLVQLIECPIFTCKDHMEPFHNLLSSSRACVGEAAPGACSVFACSGSLGMSPPCSFITSGSSTQINRAEVMRLFAVSGVRPPVEQSIRDTLDHCSAEGGRSECRLTVLSALALNKEMERTEGTHFKGAS